MARYVINYPPGDQEQLDADRSEYDQTARALIFYLGHSAVAWVPAVNVLSVHRQTTEPAEG